MALSVPQFSEGQRSRAQVEEQTLDFFVLPLREEIAEAVQFAPQERGAEQVTQQIVNVSASQVTEATRPQERMRERIAKQIVDTPVPPRKVVLVSHHLHGCENESWSRFWVGGN